MKWKRPPAPDPSIRLQLSDLEPWQRAIYQDAANSPKLQAQIMASPKAFETWATLRYGPIVRHEKDGVEKTSRSAMEERHAANPIPIERLNPVPWDSVYGDYVPVTERGQVIDSPVRPFLTGQARIDQLAEEMANREAATELAASRKKANPLVFLSRQDLKNLPKAEPLVEGLLFGSTVATFAANGGLGKTTIGLDIALCMGTNQTFLGRKVAQGRVLFIEAEGKEQFEDRISAWEQARGVDPDAAGLNIDTMPGVELNAATLRDIAEKHKREGYRLIVIDTFASSFDTKSENDNSEISRIYRQLKMLRDSVPGTCVLVMAHTTEQIDARGHRTSKHRGASSFRNDSDTLIIGSGTRDSFQLSTDGADGGKQRDAAEVRIAALRLVEVGPHVVVTNQTEAQGEASDRQVRMLVAQLEVGSEYSSGELQAVWGIPSKGKYEQTRSRAISLGLIEKTGPSNKAPYRVRSTFNLDLIGGF